MITKQTLVEEIIEKNPGAAQIFIRWGLPCLTCGEPFWGSVKELAQQNHFDRMGELLEDLNRASQNPGRMPS